MPQAGFHLSQAGTGAGGGTGDWGRLGDSTAPGSARSLPLHQGSRQQLREKQSRRRLQRSCAAGGGEAQGQGSTDLLKAKLQLQGRCPERCRAVQLLQDSAPCIRHKQLPAPQPLKLGLGTELPPQGCFCPGSVPNPRGNRICTPTGEVRVTELCPTPGKEHSPLLPPSLWSKVQISTSQP